MGRGLGGQLSWEGAGEGRKVGVWSAGEPQRVTPGDLQEVSRKRLRDGEAEPPGASRKKRRGLGASKGTGGQAGVGGKTKEGASQVPCCVWPQLLKRSNKTAPLPFSTFQASALKRPCAHPSAPSSRAPLPPGALSNASLSWPDAGGGVEQGREVEAIHHLALGLGTETAGGDSGLHISFWKTVHTKDSGYN